MTKKWFSQNGRFAIADLHAENEATSGGRFGAAQSNAPLRDFGFVLLLYLYLLNPTLFGAKRLGQLGVPPVAKKYKAPKVLTGAGVI